MGVEAHTFVRTLDGIPDVGAALDELHDAAWAATDPALLELCRLRIAMLLGNEAGLAVRTPAAVDAGFDERKAEVLARWPSSPRFDDRERAVLEFTEQFLIDVGSMSDELAERAGAHFDPSGFHAFSIALLVIEQRQRLAVAWQQLFPDEVGP